DLLLKEPRISPQAEKQVRAFPSRKIAAGKGAEKRTQLVSRAEKRGGKRDAARFGRYETSCVPFSGSFSGFCCSGLFGPVWPQLKPRPLLASCGVLHHGVPRSRGSPRQRCRTSHRRTADQYRPQSR